MKTKTHTISKAVLECERVIALAIDYFGLAVKPHNILITIQTAGRRQALGWFAHDRWQCQGRATPIHEINLSAEYLAQHDMGEVLLHELAHAENRQLGIKDCNANQYHTKKFRDMAVRVGLLVEQTQRHGYAHTSLSTTAVKFLEDISFDREVFRMARILPEKGKAPRTSLIKAECEECGYTIRVTQKWLDVGNPICPCGGEITANG